MLLSFTMKLKIIKDNNPIMRKRSLEVPLPLSNEDKKTLDEMLNYLKLSQDEEYAKKHNIRAGVGLSAIQINILKRMFVIYLKDEEEEIIYQLVNPIITESSLRSAALRGGEGCLSVDKDHDGLVHRHYRIKMKGFDAYTNKNIEIKAEGYLAIVLQHEYDHLNGMFYYDRIDKANPSEAKLNEVLI